MFADALTRFRESRGWDRKRLAEFLGVHSSFIYRWEKGAWPDESNMKHVLDAALARRSRHTEPKDKRALSGHSPKNGNDESLDPDERNNS